MTDARPHITAIKAALDAATTAGVYEYDEVPGANGNTGAEPSKYLVVSLERRFLAANRMTAQSGVTGWRVAVRAVADTVTNTELLLSQAATALNEQRLSVGGKSTEPIQFEVANAAQWDSPRYTAVATYTYAH